MRFVARASVRVLVLAHVLLVLLVRVEAVAIAAAALLSAGGPGSAPQVEGVGPRRLVGDALLLGHVLVVQDLRPPLLPPPDLLFVGLLLVLVLDGWRFPRDFCLLFVGDVLDL